MYGLTRATVTLLSAAVAGFLIWIATQVGDSSNGEYWATYGLIAGAGLVMALSQLLGGWTKWGLPRISINVFLWAFVPAAIAVVWIVIFHQPDHGLVRQGCLGRGRGEGDGKVCRRQEQNEGESARRPVHHAPSI